MVSLRHTPVLPREVLEFLQVNPRGRYLDATGGLGGHSEEILKKLGPEGRLIVTDCDLQAVTRLKEKFKDEPRCLVFLARFSELFEKLNKLLPFDGVLADLGISSYQLGDASRGIGFNQEGPLDMRLDSRLSQTAFDILHRFSQHELEGIFKTYGEERHARLFSRILVEQRRKSPIRTTTELKLLAERVLRPFYKKQKIHPATRIFQALRIAVNDELNELDILLKNLPVLLNKSGVAVVISFHSLEDREVKIFFKSLSQQGWKLLTKKPVVSCDEEVNFNPRSRSAKLRGIRKL